MTTRRTVLVTGANRGLGLECSRQLLAAGYDVVIAARVLDDAAQASSALRTASHAPESVELNVVDPASVARCEASLRAKSRRLAVLVNNAGVYPRDFSPEIAQHTLDVNYFGALRVTDAMQPLLEPNANVVMVSSGLGTLSNLAAAVARRFTAPDLTRTSLDALVHEYLASVRAGTHERDGWTASPYSLSKIALNAAARILARESPAQRINAVSPGWARTRMGGEGAPRTVTQGAESIVWAATLPANGPTGGFFEDGRAIAW